MFELYECKNVSSHFMFPLVFFWSRVGSVGTATNYSMENSRQCKNVLFFLGTQTASGAPPNRLSKWWGGGPPSSQIKRQELEAKSHLDIVPNQEW
jgi:hypothetical protein